jgi:hypothetical protein
MTKHHIAKLDTLPDGAAVEAHVVIGGTPVAVVCGRLVQRRPAREAHWIIQTGRGDARIRIGERDRATVNGNCIEIEGEWRNYGS